MWGKWELQHFWDVGWGDGRGKGCESCDDMERR